MIRVASTDHETGRSLPSICLWSSIAVSRLKAPVHLSQPGLFFDSLDVLIKHTLSSSADVRHHDMTWPVWRPCPRHEKVRTSLSAIPLPRYRGGSTIDAQGSVAGR